jgi:hypothetical protein
LSASGYSNVILAPGGACVVTVGVTSSIITTDQTATLIVTSVLGNSASVGIHAN